MLKSSLIASKKTTVRMVEKLPVAGFALSGLEQPIDGFEKLRECAHQQKPSLPLSALNATHPVNVGSIPQR